MSSINQVYQANYDALLALPIVQRLIKQNKKLSKRNKCLENLIYSLPEFRKSCYCPSQCNCASQTHLPDAICIKVEKDDSVSDSDVEIIDTSHTKPNIQYEIIEAEEEEAEEEEAEEEEAEEKEAEEEEAEEEEAEEEEAEEEDAEDEEEVVVVE